MEADHQRVVSTLPLPDAAAQDAQTLLHTSEAILFDLCGVIFDDTLWSRWLFQLVSHMGLRLQYSAFVFAWQAYARDVNAGRHEYWEAVRSFLRQLGLKRGQVDEVCAAGQSRRRQLDESVRPLPGVKAGLAQLLGCACSMSVIANTHAGAESVRATLARIGLAAYFEHVFSSVDIARQRQPQSRYAIAAEQLGVVPDRMLLVSGSIDELRDAAEAGLRSAAWQLRTAPAGIAVINDFGELLRMMRPQPRPLAV
jgi:beta-phosphoglucomutase-like phosphatase (HAD superfamily)